MSQMGTYPQGQVTTQTVVQSIPQPIIIQAPGYQQGSSCGRVIERLLARPLLIVGVVQLVIGILCILFNIVGMILHSGAAFVGHGIWCGILFILAGAFGIAAGRAKTMCYVVTCMVFSIISAVFTVPVITTSSLGWAFEADGYYYYDEPEFQHVRAREAMHALLVFLGVTEAVIAIVSSVLCCHGVCCCGTQGNVIAPPVSYAQGGQGMQVIFLQGQAPGAQQAMPVHQQLYMPQGPQVQGVYQTGQPMPVHMVSPPSYSSQPATATP